MDFDAGKYALYIWPAFGGTFLVLAALTIDTLWRSSYWRRKAEQLQAEKDARKKPAAAKADKP